MSAIANQWTGDGLPDGTVLTSTNVNTAGNGSTVSGAFTTGTATMTTEGAGFRIETSSTSAARRIESTLSGRAVRLQLQVTVSALPATASTYLMTLRDGSTNYGIVYVTTSGIVGVLMTGGSAPSGAQTPAIAAGNKLLIDVVITQSATPTTSDGRVFYRVKNLSNPSWNGSGEFFFDSGYTVNAGTVAYTTVRFGKMQAETLPTPGILYEFPGWEVITVNASHTSETQAKAYFADAPVLSVPLDTPTVTVTAYTNPSTPGASTGSITITWPAVAGAHHYEAAISPGAVSSGFTPSDTAATSPKTFTGLGAGPYTVAVRAKATA